MFEDANGLRDAIFSEDKIVGGETDKGLPLLSVTTTVSTTNWVLLVNVTGAFAGLLLRGAGQSDEQESYDSRIG